MFLGQTVYGPIMNVVFFSFNARLQGETGEEIIARLKRGLIPTLKSGLAYWPLCDFITFRFFPDHLQETDIQLIVILFSLAIDQQLLFVCLDNLFHVHGQLEEGRYV